MTETGIQIIGIHDLPSVTAATNLLDFIELGIKSLNQLPADGDILCVASKVVSICENRVIKLNDVTPSDVAIKIQRDFIPRKDPRVIQIILEQTGDLSGERVEVKKDYIAGWLPNGNKLTSAGVDKYGDEAVVVLPEDPDLSAQRISNFLSERYKKKVAVIITDSDGREEKIGATQIAIGLFGLPALRTNANSPTEKKPKETLCDLLAASAALVMGQRGTGVPLAVIHGLDFTFDPTSKISDALHSKNDLS
ncbi:coenzyme F420-0:L-glutamate ligase [Listeria sp. PSOL-1]|uniref:coenzyme F420-0:L-glutamate ligase n=1 Tax=Listeria sp. PSOL-1 TaxID=1844999 RepID=UPI0013D80CBA|nr:coenzyme F420-0:L-glutamate ligase [Listeria sp. PSOL-1]